MAQEGGILDDMEIWLSKWNLSHYQHKLTAQNITSPNEFMYCKSSQDFEQLMTAIDPKMPFMDKLKFKDAWSKIVPNKQQQAQIHFLGDKERKIMDKLYQRHNDLSDDITVVQKANNEFNESIITSKKMVNDCFEKINVSLNSKKTEILNKIDTIDERNKKLFVQKLDNLGKMNKLFLYNKDQFEVVASDRNITSTERLKKLTQLLSVSMTQTDDDEKKEATDNYDNYTIMGNKCDVPGKLTVNIDEQTLNNIINSFISIDSNTVTIDWKTKQNYYVDWSKCKKLDLSGGTGGKSGQKKYVVNNIVVEASHPVYNNNNYYYMQYMFNGNTTTDNGLCCMWLTSGPKKQTLTFTFPEAVKLAHIEGYSYTGNGYGKHKYGIEYFCDNQWNGLCDDIDTRNDVLGQKRTHEVKKFATKIRFNFEIISSHISMSEIDLFIVD